jgi:hypothetical protein
MPADTDICPMPIPPRFNASRNADKSPFSASRTAGLADTRCTFTTSPDVVTCNRSSPNEGGISRTVIAVSSWVTR